MFYHASSVYFPLYHHHLLCTRFHDRQRPPLPHLQADTCFRDCLYNRNSATRLYCLVFWSLVMKSIFMLEKTTC